MAVQKYNIILLFCFGGSRSIAIGSTAHTVSKNNLLQQHCWA